MSEIKKVISIIGVILLYSLSLLSLGWLLFLTVNPEWRVSRQGLIVLSFIFALSLYFAGIVLSAPRKKQTSKIMKMTIIALFVYYSVILCDLLFFNMNYGRQEITDVFNPLRYSNEAYNIQFSLYTNLIPFKTVWGFLLNHSIGKRELIINIFGNLIAFMPFALFLPLIFKRMKRFRNFFITVLLINVAVEILQAVFLVGSCDIDDVILNTGGALLLFFLLHRKHAKNAIEKISRLEY